MRANRQQTATKPIFLLVLTLLTLFQYRRFPYTVFDSYKREPWLFRVSRLHRPVPRSFSWKIPNRPPGDRPGERLCGIARKRVIRRLVERFYPRFSVPLAHRAHTSCRSTCMYVIILLLNPFRKKNEIANVPYGWRVLRTAPRVHI